MFGVHPIEKSCGDSEALSEESERSSVRLAERYSLSTAERNSVVITLSSAGSVEVMLNIFPRQSVEVDLKRVWPLLCLLKCHKENCRMVRLLLIVVITAVVQVQVFFITPHLLTWVTFSSNHL